MLQTFEYMCPDDIANNPRLAGVKPHFNAIAADVDSGELDSLSPLGKELAGLADLLKNGPGELKSLLQSIPQQVFAELQKLLPEQV